MIVFQRNHIIKLSKKQSEILHMPAFLLRVQVNIVRFQWDKNLEEISKCFRDRKLGNLCLWMCECCFLKKQWLAVHLPIFTPFNLTHSCSATITLRNLGVKCVSEAMITRRISMFILVIYPQLIRMIDWRLPLKAKMISYFLKRSSYKVKTSNEINIWKSCWPAYALVKVIISM